jgi:hypothetical protein
MSLHQWIHINANSVRKYMKHLVAHHPNKGKNNDSDSPATFMEETFSQKKTKCSEKSTRWIFFF